MVSCNPSLNLTVFNQLHPLFFPKFQLVVPYIASLICENACILTVKFNQKLQDNKKEEKFVILHFHRDANEDDKKCSNIRAKPLLFSCGICLFQSWCLVSLAVWWICR